MTSPPPPSLQDKEAVLAARYLEAQPRRDAARGLRTLLVRWPQSSPALSVIVCSSVLAPVPNEQTPNAVELFGQFMFANAAHQGEHSEDRDEMLPDQPAALRSMLHLYAALLALDPKARIARFDALPQMDLEDRLAVELQPLMTQGCRAVIAHD